MKIVLLNPPHDNRIYSEVPAHVGEEVCSLPPLGLMYLEAYIHAHSEHTVKIIDTLSERIGYDRLITVITAEKPDLVGITGHSHNLVDMKRVSELIKKEDEKIRVWWGGPHASAFPEESMTFREVDGVVAGEGEIAFCRVLEALGKGRPPEGIPGVLYRENGTVINNGPPCAIEELDSLPMPRREVLDYKKYYYVIGKEVTATSMVSSRGCPYQCTFCSTPGKIFRARSPMNVVDEVEALAGLGIREIYFVDDTFNIQRERALEICREIVRRKIDISWNVRARINLISEELIDSLIAAGCTRIQLGVETGSDEGLKVLKKGITIEDIRRVFAMLKKKKITSVAYFMIGCPHEKSEKDVMKTIDFACRLDPDYCLFGVFTPYPRTALYDEGVKRGIVDENAWKSFVLSPSRDFKPQAWSEFLSYEDLYRLVDVAYKKFYFRPSQMMKKLREVKSVPDLMRKIKAGLGILGAGSEH